MELSPVDIILVYVYFSGVIVAGILLRNRKEEAREFLIAGRRLTLVAFTATLVSTFYGGILGVGEFTYRHGLVSWLTQGIFYYLFAAIYAIFLAVRIRKMEQVTLPDQLFGAYDRKVGFIGSFFTFLLVSPAPYVLMIGTMLSILFPWNLKLAIVLGTLFSTVYVWFGGLRSVVKTDIIQFLLMFAGFGLCLPFAWAKLGNPVEAFSNLPRGHLQLLGDLSIQQVLAWLVIAMWTIVSPSFYQRCSAAQSPRVAQKGIFVSIAFWFLFDIMTLTAGLYARSALPNIDPIMAFPSLGNLVLPPVFRALFFIGMLATIMSTLDSLMFLSAITLGRDFLSRFRNASPLEQQSVLYTRLGLIISALFAVIVALSFRSIIDIWYTLGSLAIPVLFLPLLTSFFPQWKLSSSKTFQMMAGTGLLSSIWLTIGYLTRTNGTPEYPFHVEPIYPGILFSFLYFFVNRMKGNKRPSSRIFL